MAANRSRMGVNPQLVSGVAGECIAASCYGRGLDRTGVAGCLDWLQRSTLTGIFPKNLHGRTLEIAPFVVEAIVFLEDKDRAMRLTLLTLLAYLDDNLEPADAKELEKKIEESKFASDLVHRIRMCTRRLRLDAPKLDGKGMGLDPNTVAEFLDSTLPRDRFPDFEKVCLESDRHLAEVASCHQILTLVVDQPAQVSVELRERMYRIPTMPLPETASPQLPEKKKKSKHRRGAGGDGTEPVPPPKSTVLGSESAPPPPPAQLVRSAAGAASDLPGYLQPSDRALWPLALAFAVAFLVVGAGWVTIGPGGNPIRWLSEKFSGTSTVAQSGSSNSRNQGDSGAATGSQGKDDGASAGNRAGADGSAANGARPVDTDTATGSKDGEVENNQPSIDNEPPNPDNVPTDGAAKTGEKVPTPDSDAVADTDTPSRDPVTDKSRPSEPRGIVAENGQEVARLLSDDQVLAHVDTMTGLWQRLSRGATILSNERLVVLPTFRPIVSLSNNIQMMLDGDTAFRILGDNDAGDPVVAFEYGRAVFNTAGKSELRVRIMIGEHSGTATIRTVESELALEVQHFLPPAELNDEIGRITIVRRQATSGTIEWVTEEGESILIGKDQVCVAATGQPPRIVAADGIPVWLTRKNLSVIDRRASRELESYLHSEKALTLLLEERTGFRQVEVRSLAARCLASLHEFSPLLREMGDEKQRGYWNVAVESLREAMARSPESAKRLRQAIRSDMRENAPDLLRALRDYDQEQFEQGGARQLIELLDNDSLAVRVLAFETLRRLTGSTHNFNPERQADERRKSVMVWNQRLKEKAIPYKYVPPPGLE